MPEPRLADLGLQPPVEPMLAKRVDDIPAGDGWLYEPKWDGFRALVFISGQEVYLQSRDRRPFGRYFPELLEAWTGRFTDPLVLDGEIVVATDGGLAFDALQQRIHPAESRVRLLAEQTPASFVAFDLLAEGRESLLEAPLGERRRRLERRLEQPAPRLALTPASTAADEAHRWFERFEGAGLDGVIAKRLDERYRPGERGWFKIKHVREVDCVVAGLRWAKGAADESVGSLLLGLYDDRGVLHYVGHTSSFRAPERRALAEQLRPLITEDAAQGFGEGRTPGAESRWSRDADRSWVRLEPRLVCEVGFDQLQGIRFRHGATFRRWRPDKPPEACTFEQLHVEPPSELAEILHMSGSERAQ